MLIYRVENKATGYGPWTGTKIFPKTVHNAIFRAGSKHNPWPFLYGDFRFAFDSPQNLFRVFSPTILKTINAHFVIAVYEVNMVINSPYDDGQVQFDTYFAELVTKYSALQFIDTFKTPTA